MEPEESKRRVSTSDVEDGLVNRRKSLAILVVIGVLASPYLWRGVAQPILSRFTAWEGTIARKKEKHRGMYRSRISYLLDVECTDGTTRRTRVNRDLYIAAHKGDRVRKERNERWPQLLDRNGRERPVSLEDLREQARRRSATVRPDQPTSAPQ
jgi:hypothetical protein